MARFDTLKREVKMKLEKLEKPLDQLKMIDLLQRLGISYGFEDEIERLLLGNFKKREKNNFCTSHITHFSLFVFLLNANAFK